MTMSKWILIVASSFMWIRLSKADCYTPWGSQGHCVNIQKCDQLFKLLRQRPLPLAVLNVLKTAQCGFEGFYPKVCCETQNERPVESTMSMNKAIIEKELPTTTTTTTTTTAPPSLSLTNCYTPWGTQGHCVKIEKCDLLFKIVKQRGAAAVLNLLYKAQCGFEGRSKYPNFCCDTQNERPVDSTISMTKTIIEKNLPTTTTTTTTATPPLSLVPVVDHPNQRLLADDLCGPIAEGRIYGGNDTSINEFPWMALLGYDVGTKAPEFRCGGSIINKHYVLTAAHCISSLPEKMKLVSVRIGDYDLGTERDCDEYVDGVGFNCAPRYQEFDIDEVHIHPEFSKQKLHNDIALIRLLGEADMTPPNVRPICLPLGRTAVLKARRVVVTGWGSTEYGVRSEKLLKVTLPIMTFEKCRDAYRRQVKIWQKHICAGGSNHMDSCSGDSGGPLQAISFYNGRPRTIQYGIVSFGPHNCGIDGLPGVYTSVAHYVHWILDQMTD